LEDNEQKGKIGGQSDVKRGRKRKASEMGEGIESSLEKKLAIPADNNSAAMPVVSAQSNGTQVSSSTKKKITATFSAADVLFGILNEMQKHGVEIVSLDSPLFQLEVDDPSSDRRNCLSLLVLLWSLVAKDLEIPDLSIHIGRSASMVLDPSFLSFSFLNVSLVLRSPSIT
jgi:methionine synthase II (cobalamin-independent)